MTVFEQLTSASSCWDAGIVEAWPCWRWTGGEQAREVSGWWKRGKNGERERASVFATFFAVQVKKSVFEKRNNSGRKKASGIKKKARPEEKSRATTNDTYRLVGPGERSSEQPRGHVTSPGASGHSFKSVHTCHAALLGGWRLGIPGGGAPSWGVVIQGLRRDASNANSSLWSRVDSPPVRSFY